MKARYGRNGALEPGASQGFSSLPGGNDRSRGEWDKTFSIHQKSNGGQGGIRTLRFTSGDRVPLEGVRERISWLHRRLSKLNAQPFFQALGIRIVFRSTEHGEVRRDELGKATFHIHAHVIVHLEKKLTKERWSELLANVRGWWKHHFKDAKCIRQAREACKYVVKPEDLDQLIDSELAELHHQLFRLHLVQCLGELKEQRKDIEDTKRRLVRVPAPVSSRWELVADWNRGRPRFAR